ADGLVRIVATVDDAKQTYLPSSRKAVPFFQESLILLWHLITINPAFRKRLCSRHTEDVVAIVLPLAPAVSGPAGRLFRLASDQPLV
ncbi:cell wall bioproteinsis protein, partial [Perkinsus olseni]